MIYFIVNNNYHYYDFANQHSEFKNNNIALIEIPHNLDEREHNDLKTFYKYIRNSRPGLIGQVFNFLSLVMQIDKDITPTKDDILFIYTEYEILNQYIANRFKLAGSRVYLIEDGGFGTYIPFRLVDSEHLTWQEHLKKSIYRLLPGLSNIRLHKLNGFIFPWMVDTSIDGVCVYNPVALKRTIPIKLIKRPFQPQLKLVSGRVIFLNEPIYELYQSSEDYLTGLLQIIEALCSKFGEVFFKFHPRETDKWRNNIRQKVHIRFPGVIFIEENTAIEIIVEIYCPSLLASYFCSALLNLYDRDIEPLYLYHLIPDIKKQPIFLETTSVLIDLGYNFVSSFAEINTDFRSGLLDSSNYQEAIALTELVCRK